MTVLVRAPDMGLRGAFRVLVERLLPWYDAEREAARDRRTEAIRRRSIATRIVAERRLANYQSVRLGKR
jgi:hypothetical protein